VTSSHALDAGHAGGSQDQLEAADFVQRFERAWAQSSADALVEVLTDDVVLRQPAMPDIVGKAAAHETFKRLFRAFPGLTVTVHRWAAREDVVFIEFTLRGEFGGRPLQWPAVDRFVVRNGLAAERVSYFDGAELFLEILKRPRGWRRLAASGMRPKLP
jgi:ketosteroid isomerase-like protein